MNFGGSHQSWRFHSFSCLCQYYHVLSWSRLDYDLFTWFLSHDLFHRYVSVSPTCLAFGHAVRRPRTLYSRLPIATKSSCSACSPFDILDYKQPYCRAAIIQQYWIPRWLSWKWRLLRGLMTAHESRDLGGGSRLAVECGRVTEIPRRPQTNMALV